MSLNDVYRERHHEPGWVYIAGSLSGRFIKIGTTQDIAQAHKRLRTQKYGGLSDWLMPYWVWAEKGGKVEHDARRQLKRYKILRMYEKDGGYQKGREMVRCSFTKARCALYGLISDEAKAAECWSPHSSDYEF
jgi:hypothetical protein